MRWPACRPRARAGDDLRRRRRCARTRSWRRPVSIGGSRLPFLDVNEVRERLERVPLVSSASVRKLYPNELVIGLTERAPHALWQLNGELFIIAADGTVIDLMQDERFIGLPLVVGERANLRNNDYLDAARSRGPAQEPHPRRHPRLRAALDAQDG